MRDLARRLDMFQMPTMSRKPARRNVAPKPSRGLGLSHCASKFALAITDPWNQDAVGVCNPAGNIAIPSLKARPFARFSMAVGTGGWGFVLVHPTMANGAICVTYTDATYTQVPDGNGNLPIFSSVSPFGPLPGVKYGTFSNAPITTNDLESSGVEFGVPTKAQARLVSFGTSLQYTGTAMDLGGLIYSLVKPNHQSVSPCTADETGAQFPPYINLSSILSFAETRAARCTANKVWLTDYARCPGEEQFAPNKLTELGPSQTSDIINTVWPFSQNGIWASAALTFISTYAGAPTALHLVNAKPGNTFELEVVAHAEYAGGRVQYGLTPSHADAVGHSKVIQAAAGVGPALATDPSRSPVSAVIDGLRQAASDTASMAGAVGEKMLYTAARGGMDSLMAAGMAGGGGYALAA